jgi:hypothetical protein
MNTEDKKVDCERHGKRFYAFVCQHLLVDKKIGFWEPFESDSTKEYENGELNAWCDECDKILMEQGEWNDISEGFAQIKLVCDICFFEMKRLNKK